MNRREFLGTAGVAAAAAVAAPVDLSLQCRKDFPRGMHETYFNSAAQHPLGNHCAAGMQRYIDFMQKGPGEGRHDFWEEGFLQVKPMFAGLINAKPSEIAFTGSTTIGENTIVNGMDLRGGNVVTNDLHYTASLSNYLTRQKEQGLEVRIVKNRDWRIELRDMERAVDNTTRLIAVSFVSSVNGHMENIKALSDLAHSHKAYLFADIIQGVGSTPVDVRGMGIDFASTAMYKWLQGEHGFGFLFIKEDLIGSVVKPTEFTGHPDFNYAPWTATPKPGPTGLINHAAPGITAFDCGTQSVITYAAQYEAFKYIEKLGIASIRAHANRLIARLQKELPPLGYTPITPQGTESSIVTFQCKDAEAVRRKIRASSAKILLTGPNSALTVGRFGNHVRFSVSVFNNDKDVDTILEVLA